MEKMPLSRIQKVKSKKLAFRTWKSGKKWLFASGTLMFVAGAAVSLSSIGAQADTVNVDSSVAVSNASITTSASLSAINLGQSAALSSSTTPTAANGTSGVGSLDSIQSAYIQASLTAVETANSLSRAQTVASSDQIVLQSLMLQTSQLSDSLSTLNLQVNQLSTIVVADSSAINTTTAQSSTASISLQSVQQSISSTSLAVSLAKASADSASFNYSQASMAALQAQSAQSENASAQARVVSTSLAVSQAAMSVNHASAVYETQSTALVLAQARLSSAETAIPSIALPTAFDNSMMSLITQNPSSAALNPSVAAAMSQGLVDNHVNVDAQGYVNLDSAFASQYFSNPTDVANTIVFSSSEVALTAQQQNEITLYAAALINQVRSQLGNGLVIPTQGMMNFANQVQQNRLADGWNMVDVAKNGTNVAWHDVDAINSAAVQYGLKPSYPSSVDPAIISLASTGLNPSKYGQYYEDAAMTSNFGIKNMADLKEYVYQMFNLMLFADASESYGHTQFATGYQYGNSKPDAYFGMTLVNYNFANQEGITFESVQIPSASALTASGPLTVPDYASTLSDLTNQVAALTHLTSTAFEALGAAQANLATAQANSAQALAALKGQPVSIDLSSKLSDALLAFNTANDHLTATLAASANAKTALSAAEAAVTAANSAFNAAQNQLQSDQRLLDSAKFQQATVLSDLTNKKAELLVAQVQLQKDLMLLSTENSANGIAQDNFAALVQQLAKAKSVLLAANSSTKSAAAQKATPTVINLASPVSAVSVISNTALASQVSQKNAPESSGAAVLAVSDSTSSIKNSVSPSSSSSSSSTPSSTAIPKVSAAVYLPGHSASASPGSSSSSIETNTEQPAVKTLTNHSVPLPGANLSDTVFPKMGDEREALPLIGFAMLAGAATIGSLRWRRRSHKF